MNSLPLLEGKFALVAWVVLTFRRAEDGLVDGEILPVILTPCSRVTLSSILQLSHTINNGGFLETADQSSSMETEDSSHSLSNAFRPPVCCFEQSRHLSQLPLSEGGGGNGRLWAPFHPHLWRPKGVFFLLSCSTHTRKPGIPRKSLQQPQRQKGF